MTPKSPVNSILTEATCLPSRSNAFPAPVPRETQRLEPGPAFLHPQPIRRHSIRPRPFLGTCRSPQAPAHPRRPQSAHERTHRPGTRPASSLRAVASPTALPSAVIAANHVPPPPERTRSKRTYRPHTGVLRRVAGRVHACICVQHLPVMRTKGQGDHWNAGPRETPPPPLLPQPRSSSPGKLPVTRR